MTANRLVEADPGEFTFVNSYEVTALKTFVNNYEEAALKVKMASARVTCLVEQIEAARKAAKNAREEVQSLVRLIAAAKKEEKNARGMVRQDHQKCKKLMKTFVKKLKTQARVPSQKVGVSVQ